MTQRSIVAIIAAGPDHALTVSLHGRPVIHQTIEAWRAVVGETHLAIALDGLVTISTGVPIGRGRDRRSAIRAALDLVAGTDAVLLCSPDRPFVSGSLVDAMHAALEPGTDAVVAARPVRSTLKRVADGRVAATVSRDAWRADPGPWLFRRDALDRALDAAEAARLPIVHGHELVSAGDLLVRLVDVDGTDVPIRTQADARFAERWLASTGRPAPGSTT